MTINYFNAQRYSDLALVNVDYSNVKDEMQTTIRIRREVDKQEHKFIKALGVKQNT